MTLTGGCVESRIQKVHPAQLSPNRVLGHQKSGGLKVMDCGTEAVS